MNNDCATEARARWGNTDAYREYEQKTKNYTKEKWAEANDGLMAIFAEFAACKRRGVGADSTEVQAIVARLQAYITASYYTCTDEILAGLGKIMCRRDIQEEHRQVRRENCRICYISDR